MANKRIARVIKILVGAVADADEAMTLEGRLERFLHFWVVVVRQFLRNRCLVRASALSYSTILALIPLIVVALSVATSLLKDKNEEMLTQFVERSISSIAPSANIPAGSPQSNSVAPAGYYATNSEPAPPGNIAGQNSGTNEAAATTGDSLSAINTQKEIAHWIHELVEKASSGTLGIFGVIGLIFTAISLLRGIEETLNDMWGVTRGRNWFLQFMLYWTIITFGPLLLSSALAATGSTHFQDTRHFLESAPVLSPVVRHVVPIAILSLTLSLFYKLTPNTKVEFNAALIGGLCAGAGWHAYNQLSFIIIARALSASKFYGSIFLFVLLMGGLYILWLIILFGAQTAYAFQNRNAYAQDRLAENVNQRGREFVALRIMTCLGRRFQNGLPPATVPEIAAELGLPSRLTQSILRTLAATRLVSEAAGAEAAFMPARPLDAINAHDILIAMRTGGGQELPLTDLPELVEVYGEFARIEKAERAAAEEISLLALAHRERPRPALPAPLPDSEHEITPPPKSLVDDQAESIPHDVPERPAFPEPVEPPKPPPAPEPSRRETARPDEHPDFPL